MNTKARLIAYYLPQYHPIKENDEAWGKGFTEWTNVTKAKPLFKGHKQPKLPADLGFYDLRVPEVREQQAQMAQQYGLEGFCYWHYWTDGRRVLEKPFDQVVASGEPRLPFCIGWANHTWSGIWSNDPTRIILEQKYGGLKDYEAHFYHLLPAFSDKRYIKVEGKILFVVFQPNHIPDPFEFVDCWRKLAQKEGLNDFYFVALGMEPASKYGMDVNSQVPPGANFSQYPISNLDKVSYRLAGLSFEAWRAKILKRPKVYSYKRFVEIATRHTIQEKELPCVMPNWDNTPRTQVRGYVLTDSRPEYFKEYCEYALAHSEKKPVEQRIVFIRSWNEWAEGNYLEPDREFGYAYLEVIKEVFKA